MFDCAGFDDHEKTVFVNDKPSGLKAVIAIHSTALGAAAGGCRLWNYQTSQAALTDALRLSRGMSYKNAFAELPFGGGKAVILGPISSENRQRAFEAFGEAVHSLGGLYVTAEDVGVSVKDMEWVASKTPYVSGLAAKKGAAGGDPSPFTARGVLRGMEAAVKNKLDRDNLEGLAVAVQGLGGVGGHLCRLLSKAGASLVVADIDKAKVEKICDETGARAMSPEEVLFADVDVISPCALGGVITQENAHRIQTKIVAGGANNQLADAQAGDLLHQKGILYAPDYIINAGGIIMVAAEYQGDNDFEKVTAKVDAVKGRVTAVVDRAQRAGAPTYMIADMMAQEIIDNAARAGNSAKAQPAA